MPTMQVDPRITLERPGEERLAALKVKSWPMWTKEPSSFDWHYDERETCYFLEGDVVVKTDQGEVVLRPGDLVMFPEGLSCTWHISKAVRKHYRFG